MSSTFFPLDDSSSEVSCLNLFNHPVNLICGAYWGRFSCLDVTHPRENREQAVPHELAEGFVVGELPVVLLCEDVIDILQAPLPRQLRRGLLF